MEQQHNLKLSERLIHVANYLPQGARFADIGSDHAYLPCHVCLHDQTAVAIAGEVNQGPYESARKNVIKHGLENRISVRLGNGLRVFNDTDEIKQLVIAGMGGGLITQILSEGKGKLAKVNRLILQPNVDARQVRVWLQEHGFILIEEQILEEKGHIYEILVADKNGVNPYRDQLIEKQLLFGPYLLQEKNAVFYQKWQEELDKLQRVIDQMKLAAKPEQDKITQFKKELAWIEEELNNE